MNNAQLKLGRKESHTEVLEAEKSSYTQTSTNPVGY